MCSMMLAMRLLGMLAFSLASMLFSYSSLNCAKLVWYMQLTTLNSAIRK
jgi:hypothetical protein